MTDREAIKLALEALKQSVSAMHGLYGGWRCTTALKESDKAITALRQALEQPQFFYGQDPNVLTTHDKGAVNE